MTKAKSQDPLKSAVGELADVEATAETITPKEITAAAISDEPVADRKHALRLMIVELEARVAASEQGRDLLPLLDEAREALRIVENEREKVARS